MSKFFSLLAIILAVLLIGFILSIYYKHKDNKNDTQSSTDVDNRFYWGKNEKYKR